MTVLYLKYRPKKFADLDNLEARESLIKLFSTGSVPHAILLTGAKGIGKTSAARLIAKSLICQENDHPGKDTYEPCGHCDACLSVDSSSNLDVFETDAASNRGIDDIRDLREKIKLAPTQSRCKVYIIDEAHMLTTESFNALLKTLEEPPKHVYFVLCTTDFDKLPKTIVSRCTRVHFKKATRTEVLSRLKKVVAEEKLTASNETLEQIARYSEGSFRDGIKLLEQAASLGEINKDSVSKVIGLNNDYPIGRLLELLEHRQVKESLEWIAGADEANINFKLVIQELVEKLRQLMLKTFGVQVEQLEGEYAFSLDDIRRLVKLLQQANWEMRQNPIPSLPLEMAVIEYLSESKSSPDLGPAQKTPKTREVNSPVAKTSVAGTRAVEGNEGDKALSSDDENRGGATPVNDDDGVGTNGELRKIDDMWPAILTEVKPLNHSVLAFLRASRPLGIDTRGNLTIEVFYKFHKDQLETDRCRRIFEQAAGKVLSCDVKLKCLLGEGKPQPVQTQEEPVYEVHLDTPPLPKNKSEDIIGIAEQIFNGGVVQ